MEFLGRSVIRKHLHSVNLTKLAEKSTMNLLPQKVESQNRLCWVWDIIFQTFMFDDVWLYGGPTHKIHFGSWGGSRSRFFSFLCSPRSFFLGKPYKTLIYINTSSPTQVNRMICYLPLFLVLLKTHHQISITKYLGKNRSLHLCSHNFLWN